MNKKRTAFWYLYLSLLLTFSFIISCSGGPFAGKAVAGGSSCPFIVDNEQLFAPGDTITLNNLAEDVVVRQGSSLSIAVGNNHIMTENGYLLKSCQEPFLGIILHPTAGSAASAGWIVNKHNPDGVGATGTIVVDQTFEPGKLHYFFVFACRWIEEERGWDCHGDDENPSKWMMVSFTATSCNDGVQNGDETDVDCGGSCELKCIAGKKCSLSTDCWQGLSCQEGQCLDLCRDGQASPGESDVDCGGSCGATCIAGQQCESVADCQADLSCGVGSTCTLFCTDGRMNNGETDIDCGGSCEAKCAAGKQCSLLADCQSGLVCGTLRQCVHPCQDGLLTVGETDIDCGGPCPAKCAAGKVCQADTDCQSGLVCTQRKCVAPKRPPRFWAVGNTVDERRIYYSEDGGKSWKVQYATKGKSQQDITFPDKKTGYVVGPAGSILKTTDTGKNWVAQVSGTTSDLYGIDCVDNTRCWAAGGGGTILFTGDGGKSWVQQITGTGQQFEEVFFIDEFQGWAVGAGSNIFHTIDGGVTWEQQKTGTNSQFYDLQCIDQNCWAVGSGTKVNMVQTIDGGLSWTPVVVPATGKLNAIQFATFMTGYAAGSYVALKTTDGGLSWQTLPIDTRWTFNDLFFVDENVGCGVGFTSGRNGRIFCTSDGGKTWTQWGEGTGMYSFNGLTGRP